MIEEFTDIRQTSRAEQIRAWCVKTAIEKIGEAPVRQGVVTKLAAEIEEYLIEGGNLTENTLRKVNDALMSDSDLGFKEADAIAVINVLHNAGIMFRERS